MIKKFDCLLLVRRSDAYRTYINSLFLSSRPTIPQMQSYKWMNEEAVAQPIYQMKRSMCIIFALTSEPCFKPKPNDVDNKNKFYEKQQNQAAKLQGISSVPSFFSGTFLSLLFLWPNFIQINFRSFQSLFLLIFFSLFLCLYLYNIHFAFYALDFLSGLLCVFS